MKKSCLLFHRNVDAAIFIYTFLFSSFVRLSKKKKEKNIVYFRSRLRIQNCRKKLAKCKHSASHHTVYWKWNTNETEQKDKMKKIYYNIRQKCLLTWPKIKLNFVYDKTMNQYHIHKQKFHFHGEKKKSKRNFFCFYFIFSIFGYSIYCCLKFVNWILLRCIIPLLGEKWLSRCRERQWCLLFAESQWLHSKKIDSIFLCEYHKQHQPKMTFQFKLHFRCSQVINKNHAKCQACVREREREREWGHKEEEKRAKWRARLKAEKRIYNNFASINCQ